MRRVMILARLLFVICLVLPLNVAVAPVQVAAQDPAESGERAVSAEVAALKASGLTNWDELAQKAAIDKIDPLLQDAARNGGKDVVAVSITYLPGADVGGYLEQPIERPALLSDLHRVQGLIRTSDLLKVASDPNVVAVVDATVTLRPKPQGVDRAEPLSAAERAARIDALRANEVPWSDTAAAQGEVQGQGWFDVRGGHQSIGAWEKGFTGQGVIVGVLDDGVDFAHPDLQGTYAVNTDPSSPYYGWPMSFSQVSMTYWVQEVLYQDLGAHGISEGWAGALWSDTSTTAVADGNGQVEYTPVAGATHLYTTTGTSLSGEYKLGTYHDRHLSGTYGERVAILVVDEHEAGVYDTVYIDLDHDLDFRDEKPTTQDSPISYRDMNDDGYADISGGLLVWIADGANLPPMVDWLWGIAPGDEVGTIKAVPDSGELLIFTGPFDDDYSHGTQCASAVAAQGVVSGGLTAQPFAEGGMVQGAAPEVGVMDFSNHYYSGTDEDEYLVVALGYDGIADSGDEVQVASNSYGSFQQLWGSWGYFGRLITAINLDLAPTSLWVFSAGNEGPGYGPQEGDGGPTTLQVGTSTQYGSTNWDSIASADQIVHGDASNWYSHGPNNDGSVGVDVLTNGGRGSGDEALNYYGFNGAESWATWGGTSRSAPAAAGNLALIYQAYKARYGQWPTWDVAKALIKSSATDASGSPFLQGAGVVNADRGTDVASGVYGLYATPDEWRVGDWEGQQHLNFANVAAPGTSWQQDITLTNTGGFAIKPDLSDAVMVKFDEMQLEFQTKYQG
ncbi:MAG: S8 family serine peptidase, partial [Anaerolineales bacterium]